ncbi:hypothetical protein [Lutispora saccharofermentans]|uniref:Uncharacterized protein n=1 Tax=Lutispora saccharofermentans TaxID=3024236 RepID=A0ABT1NG57_9FIRM|nr:hypothetical protein [Lutispora saccharofermentans]MCQ1530218.1 hypothetical protein [Lutispora saccharofermentans]
MTYEELIERVTWGEEFSFKYNNEKYWISQNKDGRYLTRVRDSYTQGFKTTAELFEKGRIEGKTILEIWSFIHEQF